jgi:hypothetical protein
MGIWLRSEPSADPTGEPSAQSRAATSPVSASESAAREMPNPDSSPDSGASRGALVIESGETLTIEAGALPSSGTLTVELRLPPPADPATAVLEARIIDPQSGVTKLSAQIGEDDRAGAVIRIPTDTLRLAGRYIVELETTELSHFPLRRYAIEVR